MLKRILYLWAVRNPGASYVQGINDLATPFVWVFLEEVRIWTKGGWGENFHNLWHARQFNFDR